MFSFIQRIDDAVISAFENVNIPVITPILAFFTYIGDHGLVWIAAAIIMLLFKRTRKIGYCIGLSLILGLLVCNIILKPLIARTRPYDLFGYVPLIDKPYDFSFPSGHTCAAFEGGVSCLLFDKKIGTVAMVVAVIIAFSRIYFRVHYLSDVLAGAVIGSLIAIFSYYIIKAVDKKVGNK